LAVHRGVFCAFEGFTRLRTSFDLCQYVHDLCLIVSQNSDVADSVSLESI
jgi:hypothetical protein